jgi:hypothetical protein
METISRDTFKDHELFAEIMQKESHHDHEIVDEGHGPRWKEDPDISKLVDDMGGLNNIVRLFFATGITKNDEAWRKLYRDIGYSLYGYWEIFYWEMNNEDAADYRSDC